MFGIRRREFVALFGGATAAWPLAARAQRPAIPVVGFLGASSPETNVERLRAFRLGLKEMGYVEDDNVTVLYRWAENASIGWRNWPSISLSARSPCLSLSEMLLRGRQRR